MSLSKKILFTCSVVFAIVVLVSLSLNSINASGTIKADKSTQSDWQGPITKNFRYLRFVQAGNLAFSWHYVLSYRTIEGAVSEIAYLDHYRHKVVRCYLDKTLDMVNNEISLVRDPSKGETLCLGTLYPITKSEWNLNS